MPILYELVLKSIATKCFVSHGRALLRFSSLCRWQSSDFAAFTLVWANGEWIIYDEHLLLQNHLSQLKMETKEYENNYFGIIRNIYFKTWTRYNKAIQRESNQEQK